MSIATVGDNLIHYEAVGRGEPLIFIHGWLGSWRYWWASMQALSAHYRTFAFDLWGFGDSSKRSDKYSLDDYVEMLDQFIDRLGIVQPVTVIGHSLGAAVGLRFALEHPERVKRLATVALPIRGDYIHSRLSESDSETVINRVLGRANSHPEVESELRKTDQEAMNRLAQELTAKDFTLDLDNPPVPMLLVFGQEDPIVRYTEDITANIQEPRHNRAFISLESCYHFPMLEEKAKFNRLLLDFIRSNSNLSDLSPKEYWQRRTH